MVSEADECGQSLEGWRVSHWRHLRPMLIDMRQRIRLTRISPVSYRVRKPMSTVVYASTIDKLCTYVSNV